MQIAIDAIVLGKKYELPDFVLVAENIVKATIQAGISAACSQPHPLY